MKIFTTIMLICFISIYSHASDEDFKPPLTQFKQIMESGKVDLTEIDKLFINDVDKEKVIAFITDYKVNSFIFSIIKGQLMDNKQYKVTTKIMLDFTKRNGIVNNGFKFNSTFYVQKDVDQMYILNTDFFDEINNVRRWGILMAIYVFVTLTAFGHAILYKKEKKWILIIMCMGAIFYYFHIFSKHKKVR